MRTKRSLRAMIVLAAALRGLAVGFVSLYFPLELARSGAGPIYVGVVTGAGLLGMTLSSLWVGAWGWKWSPARSLAVLSFLMAAAGVALAFPLPPAAVGALAFLGMLNGMGRDRSGLRALDQVLLPALVEDRERTQAFAAYNILLDLAHAGGGALAGISWARPWGMLAYAGILAVSGATYLFCQVPIMAPIGQKPEIRPETRKKVKALTLLFLLDSLGGGFLTNGLIAYWFFIRFQASRFTISALFFTARILNMASNVAAVWLSRKIGLVRTMVFTHLPSSLLLLSAAFVPSFGVAAFFFLLRESLVQMDVPARESYVMALVGPHERPYAAGLTNTVRNLGWALAPAFGGAGMAYFSGFALVAGSVLKIIYDLLLYVQFRHVRPVEESA